MKTRRGVTRESAGRPRRRSLIGIITDGRRGFMCRPRVLRLGCLLLVWLLLAGLPAGCGYSGAREDGSQSGAALTGAAAEEENASAGLDISGETEMAVADGNEGALSAGPDMSGEAEMAVADGSEGALSAGPKPDAAGEEISPAVGQKGAEAVLPEGWTPDLVAVVTSDLHFDLDARFSIYPLMAHIQEIAEIMADQVIALRPDVFIMTGDNTNSGDEEDVAALMEILRRIRAAGIEVIVTTGNHDFDRGHLWEPYKELCEPVLKDEATESFALDLGGCRFLVMDDNSAGKEVGGTFPASTLAWMEEAMDTENEVIFLSHHNVLPGGEASVGSSYNIQVPELRDILSDGGVRLCLTGHRHTQEILHYYNMYEIISSPLAAAPHQFGILELGGGCCRYRTEVLDLGMDLLTEEVETGAGRNESIAQTADFSGRRQFKKDRILALFRTFMDCVARGTLADRRDEIAGDECYEDMLAAFAETNYGPWIRARMEAESLPGNRLVIGGVE